MSEAPKNISKPYSSYWDRNWDSRITHKSCGGEKGEGYGKEDWKRTGEDRSKKWRSGRITGMVLKIRKALKSMSVSDISFISCARY